MEEIRELIFQDDPFRMNWLRQDYRYGEVRCAKGVESTVSHRKEGDVVHTDIRFRNTTDKPIFTSLGDIGIAFPLEDRYDSSRVCMRQRCHTHIFCGGEVSYIMALRMGGKAPHLGMVLTRGSLGGYSVERDTAKMSNDRGCFFLHPSPMELMPGEEREVCFVIFPHQGKEDFYERAAAFTRFVRVEASAWVLFCGEECRITIEPSFAAGSVQVDGEEIPQKDGKYELVYRDTQRCGEKVFSVCVDGIHTWCRILVTEQPKELARRRCLFIAQHQQYGGQSACGGRPEKEANPACGGRPGQEANPACGGGLGQGADLACEERPGKQAACDESQGIGGSRPVGSLEGAYLAYDNEEEHMYYDRNNDYNGGRERVGMGILMAEYLQLRKEEASGSLPAEGGSLKDREVLFLEESLKRYLAYVERELVDVETGEVFNDFGRDGSYRRLYNLPWFAEFYVELYQLYGKREYLTRAVRILRYYYQDGGKGHYPIELPVLLLTQALEEAGMQEERADMEKLFRGHADRIAEVGCDYPPSEVNYEQSIVAPAADILLQVYMLTKEEKYLEAGREQLAILELFNGTQPDWHLHETAIRHWDGYWFGKRKLYGDTFPHYWSALTGNCFALYERITGEAIYGKRAVDSLRGVLPMIHCDGRASCAYVFPASVNGRQADCYDPYANDQDWALYFTLRMKCAKIF